MKTIMLGLAGALLLSGCTATMQTTTRQSTPYAPTNEIRGGTVSYLDEGADFMRTRRREDAYKKMHDYCGGDYRIVSEGTRTDSGSAMPIGGIVYENVEKTVLIKFACADQKEPS